MNTQSPENPPLDALLSRNETIKWLYEFLNSDSIQNMDIKITQIDKKNGIVLYCFCCEILQAYLSEMNKKVKEAVLSNVHDSFIVFFLCISPKGGAQREKVFFQFLSP